MPEGKKTAIVGVRKARRLFTAVGRGGYAAPVPDCLFLRLSPKPERILHCIPILKYIRVHRSEFLSARSPRGF